MEGREQIVIRVLINFVQHTKPSHKTSMTERQETLMRTKTANRIHLALKKLKVKFSSWPPHRRTILKDWENKCQIATKYHSGVHKYTFHQPQNTNSLRDARNNKKVKKSLLWPGASNERIYYHRMRVNY